MPETMKLFGSATGKITPGGNGENMPHIEIAEVVLSHFNIANIDFKI